MARPEKVYSNDSGDYKETVKHAVLMCSNVQGNNNKFYSLEIQKNDNGECVLFSHYGRITGDTIKGGVYEVRPPFNYEDSAMKEFESIVKKKQRGKTRKKDGVSYKETYEAVDIVSSSVGSSNVVGKAGEVTSKTKLDLNLFNDFGKVESVMLKKLEEENIHDITNSTTMTYTGNGLQTPLGPLTFDHLTKAKNVLNKINGKINASSTKIGVELKRLNSQYLSLIPRNLGNKIDDDSLISTGDNVSVEYDLLNQMETAITLAELKDDSDDKETELGFSIKLASKTIQKEIEKQVESSRKHRNLSNYKVKRVYQIENFKERKAFELFSDKLQDDFAAKNKKREHKLDYMELDLFHGSRNSNILSILMNGFYVPPENASHVTGRMFGNGIYSADSSTKALNYSAGYWGGQRNKYDNLFCFVVRCATGKVHETQHSLYSGVPRGHNSIFAKGGADLKNNEYITKNTAQVTMSYLVEF
jgi:poly [ADP-ribose] polymerase